MNDDELIKLWKDDISSQEIVVEYTMDLTFDFKIACMPQAEQMISRRIQLAQDAMRAGW
jgi:hypothetical protein